MSIYSLFLPPFITIHLTCFMATPQYGLQEGYSTYTPHNVLYSTNTLKNRRRTTTHLLNACKLYTTIESLAHVHMLPLTHEQSHHYSLTNCVYPGKGAMQEKKQTIIIECKMTFTVWSTRMTTRKYGLQECNSTYTPVFVRERVSCKRKYKR